MLNWDTYSFNFKAPSFKIILLSIFLVRNSGLQTNNSLKMSNKWVTELWKMSLKYM